MKNIFSSILLIGLALLYACGGGTTTSKVDDKKLLEEAAEIHNEAIKIDKVLQPRLKSLIEKSNGLQVVGRPLTPDEQLTIRAIDQIRARYEYWDKNHIEVPGHEGAHDHDHDHDHDHSHGASLELSATDMLSVQKEFRDSIIAIQKSIEKLD